ncbi:MAG: NUDIX hydrolase N-terminal domain-containing protein, partial [Anaerolineae bacterium]|nr:NUDIX hydrolase N-terminal domain-containing protein [Anaerolineae bacterium]
MNNCEEKSDSPARQIALWADRLHDVSALGLHFAKNIYDRAHYKVVQDAAMALMALATGTPIEAMEPLRATVFVRPTPLATGDAAVIDPEDGRMLLVRRADNGLWAMPGGAFEVGETPAEATAREVLEETGIRCEVTTLAGVFDSRLCGTESPYHLYHFVFICRPLNRTRPEPSSTPGEVTNIAWFAEAELPTALSPGHATRIQEAWRVWR